MIKCMFQDCNCEATKTIPCIICPKEIKEDIHVCEFHFNLMRSPEPFVISMDIKGEKNESINRRR